MSKPNRGERAVIRMLDRGVKPETIKAFLREVQKQVSQEARAAKGGVSDGR